LQDVSFQSDTDSEVIVHLIEKLAEEGMDVEEAIRKTLTLLEGSYAIAIIDTENTDTIFVAKNKSPLLVGVGDGFNVVASDAMAMIQITDTYIELMDQEMVVLKRDEVTIKNLAGEVVNRDSYKAE